MGKKCKKCGQKASPRLLFNFGKQPKAANECKTLQRELSKKPFVLLCTLFFYGQDYEEKQKESKTDLMKSGFKLFQQSHLIFENLQTVKDKEKMTKDEYLENRKIFQMK